MTIQEALDAANPNFFLDALRQVDMGAVLAGLRPRMTARTGLASQATHVHSIPGAILSVDDGSAVGLLIISSGSPGATECLVTYDAQGLATLTFSGAVTAYSVTQLVIPSAYATTLASDSGSAV